MQVFKKSLGNYNIFKRISITDSEKYLYTEQYFLENAVTFDILLTVNNSYNQFKQELKTYYKLNIPRGKWIKQGI